MNTKPTRKRSKARTGLFLLVALSVVGVLLEGASFLLHWVGSGHAFSYARLDEERGRIAAGHDTVEPEQAIPSVLNFLTLHPYLGYVFDIKATHIDESLRQRKAVVNPFGMTGLSPIQKRDPTKLLVGITGGSVAHAMVMEVQDQIERAIADLPQYRSRKVSVLSLALGGYKQPQQLMALSYFLCAGAELDLLINLDGYNEVIATNANIEAGVFPLYPTEWFTLAGASPERERLRRIGRLVDAQERRKTTATSFSGALTSRSVTAQLVWQILDRRSGAAIAAARAEILEFRSDERPFREFGAGAAGWNGANKLRLVAEVWRRCSVQLDRTCRANGIRYYHFLQPNQYLPDTKRWGPGERGTVYDAANFARPLIENCYPAMIQEGTELHRAGVRFRDLTALFKDVAETLYIDTCCHLNPRGHELLARAIVATIAEHAELESAELQGIRAAPASVTIDDPMMPQRVNVLGKFSDGRERSVSAAHCGTSYESSAPDVVAATQDGELRATREGAATITVRNRSFTTQVAIESRWLPVTTFGSGVPGRGDVTPVLATDGREPRIGCADFTLRMHKVRGGATGVLVLTDRAPQLYPHVSLDALPADQLTVLNIQANGPKDEPGAGSVELQFPIPSDPTARGRTSYLQAIFEDDAAAGGRSSSNGLRLTVQ